MERIEEGLGRRGASESRVHRELKRLSGDWLKDEGFRLCATEVRVPLSNYRADVVAYRPRLRYSVSPGETAVVECKASRADFLRDAGIEDDFVLRRKAAGKRLEGLLEMMRMHLPQCRLGVSLFAEYDTYDFGSVRHEGWRRLASELDFLGRKLSGGLKLSKMARYSGANYFYLAVEEGVLASLDEVPPVWGILRREGDSLVVERPALKLAAKTETRLKMLERIAGK